MTAEEKPALVGRDKFDSSRDVYFHRTLFHDDVCIAMFDVSVFAFFQLLSVSVGVVQRPHDAAFQSHRKRTSIEQLLHYRTCRKRLDHPRRQTCTYTHNFGFFFLASIVLYIAKISAKSTAPCE